MIFGFNSSLTWEYLDDSDNLIDSMWNLNRANQV